MLRVIVCGCALVAACTSFAVADDEALKELNERYQLQRKRFEDFLQDAEKLRTQPEVLESLDPRNSFIPELIAIEEANRGQPAAISAIYQLVRNAVGMGDPESPAALGRVKAIKIMREHYVQHADLDLPLRFVEGGSFTPSGEGLLRDATNSTHPHVRAAARYRLARFLVLKATLAKIFSQELKPSDNKQLSPRLIEIVRKRREVINNLAIDPAAERKAAIAVIEELIAQDPTVVLSLATQDGPSELSIRRASPDSLQPTYAKLAQALRFELEHLQQGQVAPDIAGKDADGIEFKLSDYRGRVVLLIFSADWCGPCKAMYPDLRQLQTELAGEPFATLAVMGDQAVETVVQATRQGDIRWRSWFDGFNGPIATTWNTNSWPTLYLLDHKGVIVNRQPGRECEELRKLIEPLLAAQKADPQAAEQLKAHSLPELPILESSK